MVSLQEDRQEEAVCPICQEHLKEAVSTDCKHLFCRVCLAQHMEKALASGALCCPLCRKPYSERVLGEGYICHKHQKRFQRFCEKSKCLLCVECLESLEHQSHSEPTIENAISHYKERLTRRFRKLRKDIGELQRLKAQEEEKLQALQSFFMRNTAASVMPVTQGGCPTRGRGLRNQHSYSGIQLWRARREPSDIES
ncbi:E3 ubiquitin ligase TRIM40 isoform X1 [Marmota monax]|uniref:E3 ubiquitin ligase TRIM40 isoform X1 n=1 Tax=Marmota monax TaxID=9995 RepID=UPI001EAFA590|nr:E3 ubiquitin ligase TRIM40 isoform X1 [Marmota monax]XP_058436643.1 E3 ubiquitin ligase TRIM40 isoform X1 [Marmota monax]XP_058436644.1 E3 ubiquitin ligase TRIM40 isoform X1 [Marmota monax]XP_058436645.1 E3 ubiquitin ligase TRIM40 isoform X1 [Marmota monax]XP_058436646.1 E3 ubiquitin ligase TRIM40 isoform X1 [Marmota monax]